MLDFYLSIKEVSMKKTAVLIVLAVVLLFASPLAKGKDSGVKLSFGAGISLPTGTLQDEWKSGFNLGGTVSHTFHKNLSIIGDLQYNRFSLDNNADNLKGYDLDGGSYSVTTLMTGVRYSIPFEGKSAFYLQGGVGIAFSSLKDIEIELDADEVQALQVGIAFSSLKDIEMAGYTIIKGDSSTDLALMAGTGWEYRVNRNETLFVELRYVNVLNEGPNLAFFPLRIGASFKF